MVADADGRNAKTVASDKSAFSGNLSLGRVDWRLASAACGVAPR
jgi:hypothetical protein